MYWSLLLLFRVFFSLKVRRTENLKKEDDLFIVEVNHVSYLDPISVPLAMPFILIYFPLYHMATDYIYYKALFFYRLVGAVRARKDRDPELSGKN